MVSEKVAALRKKLSSRRTRTTLSASQKLARRTPARTLWWWLSIVVLASSGGFIPPAVAMAYSVTEGWDGGGQFVLLIVAGLFQGFALGIGEVIALRRGPVRVPVWRWIIVTTFASASSKLAIRHCSRFWQGGRDDIPNRARLSFIRLKSVFTVKC